MTVGWNPEAVKDLQTIRDHYLQFNPETAEKVTRGIILATRRLKNFPASGRIVPEINDPLIREVIWSNWRIIYLLPTSNNESLEVLNIIHTSRDF